MLADFVALKETRIKKLVLILVLLEYARRRAYYQITLKGARVLILVLLEYARRLFRAFRIG